MELKGIRRQIVDEVNYGIYVWELPDGEYLGDGDGHIMMIPSTRNNLLRRRALESAARSYGFSEGRAVFLAGHRPVTDEEYQEQVAREKLGLVPDPLEAIAMRDG